MKQIQVFISQRVQVSSTITTDLTRAVHLADEARINKARVLDSALTIENTLARILSHYFFGPSHKRKSVFEAMILNSDWCTLAAKRKLIKHMINEQQLLSGKEKEDFDRLLRRVMSLRNAFAHGTFSSDGKNTVWLSFFEGTPQKQQLTDEFLTGVEETLTQAYKLVDAMEDKIAIEPRSQ